MSSSEQDARRAAQKPFLVSLVLSLVIVMVGITWTWRVGQQSNLVAHRLGHLTDGLEDLRHIVARQEAHRP